MQADSAAMTPSSTAPAAEAPHSDAMWHIGADFNYNLRYGQWFDVTAFSGSGMIQNGIGFDLYMKKIVGEEGKLHWDVGFQMSYMGGFPSTQQSIASGNSFNILEAQLAETHALQFGGFFGIVMPKAKHLTINVEAAVGPEWLTMQYITQDNSQQATPISGSGVSGKVGLKFQIAPVMIHDAKIITNLGIYYGFGDILPFANGLSQATLGGGAQIWGLHGNSFLLTVGAGLEL